MHERTRSMDKCLIEGSSILTAEPAKNPVINGLDPSDGACYLNGKQWMALNAAVVLTAACASQAPKLPTVVPSNNAVSQITVLPPDYATCQGLILENRFSVTGVTPSTPALLTAEIEGQDGTSNLIIQDDQDSTYSMHLRAKLPDEDHNGSPDKKSLEIEFTSTNAAGQKVTAQCY